MTVLVMVVCIGAALLDCAEVRVVYDSRDKCILGAPVAIGEWQLGHEGWIVDRWRCEPFDPDDRPG